MQGAREKCLEAGCDEFATKPINRTELADLITAYWKGEKMHETAQLTSPALVSEMADDEDMIELIEMFVDELPDRISVIEDAVEQQDADLLKTVAHQLKGAAGGYGFPTITTFAASLEATIKSGEDFTSIERKASDLVDLCRRAAATASAV
jgi:HPt (histidine-containing phosphotransfer) domain-containing protein